MEQKSSKKYWKLTILVIFMILIILIIYILFIAKLKYKKYDLKSDIITIIDTSNGYSSTIVDNKEEIGTIIELFNNGKIVEYHKKQECEQCAKIVKTLIIFDETGTYIEILDDGSAFIRNGEQKSNITINEKTIEYIKEKLLEQ